MELYMFGRLLVLDGKESAFESPLREVVTLRLRPGQTSTRVEAGCPFGSAQGKLGGAWVPVAAKWRLYYLHSRWKR
jgi:hypothetical protein